MRIGFIIQGNFLLNLALIKSIKKLKQDHEIIFIAHNDKKNRYAFNIISCLLQSFPISLVLYCTTLLTLILHSIAKRKHTRLKKYCSIEQIDYVDLQHALAIAKTVDFLICITNKYLTEHIIYAPKFGAINIHPGLLPENKGAMPYIWSINQNIPIGVSAHIMTTEVDEGPVLLKKQIPLKTHSLMTFSCYILILLPRIISLSIQRAISQHYIHTHHINGVYNTLPKCEDFTNFKKNKGKLARLTDIIFCQRLL